MTTATTIKARLAAATLAVVLALAAARCGRDIELGVAPPVDGGADAADAGAGGSG